MSQADTYKKTLKNKKVLVTGADGFIGSHLTEMLVETAGHVRALTYYNSFNSAGWLDSSPIRNTSNLEVIPGDIRDAGCVEAASEGVDIIFHLAALIAIPYSYRAPDSYIQTNIEGTLNVLKAARKTGARMIHTSTSEVYGTAQTVPISESHPLVGQSPYSASKIGADKMAESFHLSFDMPVVTVRPFNTYGPRQSARAVIPTIIQQCVQGNTSEIKLGSLTPTRDLTFVEDTCTGFLAAATLDKAIGETLNLGVGEEISIGDLAALIAKICGKDIKITEDTERLRPQNSEVERLVSDNSKAKSLLDWAPVHTLEDGLSKTIQWFKENPTSHDVSKFVV